MFFDYVKKIKQNVTMIDICEKYGLEINRSHKVLCPFHNDEHNSMHIYTNSFYCFSCGEHGDVFAFIEKYFNLKFTEAVHKINDDFQLNLFSKNADIKISKSEEINNRKQEKLQLLKEYDNAVKYYIEVDKTIAKLQPKKIEDITQEYAQALRMREYAEYKKDLARYQLDEWRKNKCQQ